MVLCNKEGGRRLRFVMLRENGPMQNGIVPYFTVVQPDGTPCFRIIGEKMERERSARAFSGSARRLFRIIPFGRRSERELC